MPAPPKSRRLGILTTLAVLVILVGGGIGVAVALHKSGPPSCPGCGSNNTVGDPLREAATFTSTDAHFAVDYPSGWSIVSQSGNGVTLHTSVTRNGKVLIEGVFIVQSDSSTTDTSALIDKGKQLAQSAGFSDLKDAGAIRGAHIGDTDGDGRSFTGTLTGGGGSRQNAAIAIVAASKNGLGVVVVGGDPADSAGSSSPLEGDIFDYVLTEFRWP